MIVLKKIFVIVTSLFLFSCGRNEPAAAVASQPAQIVPIAQRALNSIISEPSGIVYNAKNNSFFVVSDSHPELYEIDFFGNLLRTITTTSTDLEGISLSRSGDTIIVAEERNRKIVFYALNGTKLSSFSANVATLDNNALEGVTVAGNGNFFVINEKLPGMLLEYAPNGTEIKRILLSFAGDYSDIFYDSTQNCLWIISDESKKIMKVSTSGALISEWGIPFTKGEGISIVRDTIYVVNDADAKLYLFNKPK